MGWLLGNVGHEIEGSGKKKASYFLSKPFICFIILYSEGGNMICSVLSFSFIQAQSEAPKCQ